MKTKCLYILLICCIIVAVGIVMCFVRFPNNPGDNTLQTRESNLIYVAKLKNGFSPWVYIQLYDNGLLKVSASYYTHTLTYDNTPSFEYTLFSSNLQDVDLNDLKMQISNLPPIFSEAISISDTWMYYALCDGEEVWFSPYSAVNSKHAALVKRILELSEVDLYSTYSLPWPE